MPRVRVHDVELHYELLAGRRGPGGGDDRTQTVALLNGIAMTIASWSRLGQRLARRGHRCLLHDLRGQLLSDKPPGAADYSFEAHVADLAGLLDRLEIDRVHLVGTSYGSEVGQLFAARHPDRVHTLTVIAGVSELDAGLVAIADGWARAAGRGAEALYREMIPWVYSAAYRQQHGRQLEHEARTMRALPAADDFCRGFERLCGAFRQLDLTAELSRIRCPTLVVAAEHDRVKPPRFSRVIHEQITGSELVVIADAGHAVVFERPETVAELVCDFIARRCACTP